METTREERGRATELFDCEGGDPENTAELPAGDLARFVRDADLAGELLEALEGVVRWADCMLSERGQSAIPVEEAREAIAKAHGEAQDG